MRIIIDWGSYFLSILWIGLTSIAKVIFVMVVASVAVGFIHAYTGFMVYLLPASSILWNLEVFLLNAIDYDPTLTNILTPCAKYIADNHASIRLMIAITGGILAACLQWMIVAWLYISIWLGGKMFETIKK